MTQNEQVTFEKIRNLSPELQQQVLTYVESLLSEAKTHSDNKEEKRYGYGSWKGDIVIADDFDEPLADLEKYM
jgi:hypothetical protein